MENLNNLLLYLKTNYSEFNPVKRNDTIEFKVKDFLPLEVEDKLKRYLQMNYPEYKIDNFYEKEEDKINYPRIKKQQLSEKKLTKPEKKEKEKIVKGLKGQKKDFVKRYGKKDAEAVMYATATKLAKQVKESDKQKVEEAVIKYFEAKKAKPDFLDLDKDGNKKESMKKAAKDAKKKGTKIEEESMLFTNDFAKQDQVNYIDDEGRMAKQQLYKIKKYAQELCDMLDDNTQLEGWVQAKITKAEEAIGAVKHYMEYEMFRKQQG